MLQGLPNEVLLLILKEVGVPMLTTVVQEYSRVQLPDLGDLKQLCEVSKELYDLTLSKLYETVVISSESEKNLERIDIKPFLEGNVTDCLKHTKHVRISSSTKILIREAFISGAWRMRPQIISASNCQIKQ